MLTTKEIKYIKKTTLYDENRLAYVFGALSDEKRLYIVKLLLEHDELCVTDVANIVDLSVSATSRQLKILELADIVKRRRCGQEICYFINKKNALLKCISKLI